MRNLQYLVTIYMFPALYIHVLSNMDEYSQALFLTPLPTMTHICVMDAYIFRTPIRIFWGVSILGIKYIICDRIGNKGPI